MGRYTKTYGVKVLLELSFVALLFGIDVYMYHVINKYSFFFGKIISPTFIITRLLTYYYIIGNYLVTKKLFVTSGASTYIFQEHFYQAIYSPIITVRIYIINTCNTLLNINVQVLCTLSHAVILWNKPFLLKSEMYKNQFINFKSQL